MLHLLILNVLLTTVCILTLVPHYHLGLGVSKRPMLLQYGLRRLEFRTHQVSLRRSHLLKIVCSLPLANQLAIQPLLHQTPVLAPILGFHHTMFRKRNSRKIRLDLTLLIMGHYTLVLLRNTYPHHLGQPLVDLLLRPRVLLQRLLGRSGNVLPLLMNVGEASLHPVDLVIGRLQTEICLANVHPFTGLTMGLRGPYVMKKADHIAEIICRLLLHLENEALVLTFLLAPLHPGAIGTTDLIRLTGVLVVMNHRI